MIVGAKELYGFSLHYAYRVELSSAIFEGNSKMR